MRSSNKSAFPAILKGKTSATPVRIWVPGCSTGQEAYSLAIALLEFLDDNLIPPPIQIFATDLSDTMSLQKAREGLYPENIEAEVSPERLRRFFTREDGKYRINKSIRNLCVFAKQNVAGDPPFSRVDLISCRNLLIYLAQSLQKRVIPTFHYALNPTGFLLLGASETIGGFTDLFDVVDFGCRLYVKKEPAMRQYPHFNNAEMPTAAGIPGVLAPTVTAADWQREADRTLLRIYAPAGVLVNNHLDILQFRGRTGLYLEPAPGEPSHNLLRMAREGLFPELRNAIDECRQKNAAVRRPGVRVRGNGQALEIDLHIVPVKLLGISEGCFLILFEEDRSPANRAVFSGSNSPGAAGARPTPATGWLGRWFVRSPARTPASADGALSDDRAEAELKKELASTRDYLQCVIEQKDTANEELKSANEEILSSNEELQSTNEELTTAKEELQSVNEELTTTNEQLHHRNLGLNRLNDDLTNLLHSANVPIVILGSDLCIRRFTPVAGKVLNLLPTDVNRPIDDIKPTLDIPDLEQLLLEVIDTVQVREREVRDRDGRWHALQIHPYRTADNKIDGAVIVLLDIHQAKIAQDELGRRVEERTAELAQANEALKAEVAAHKQAEAARMELLQQLVTAQEEERHRLARELHDQMGQHLTALSLGLKVVKDATPESSPACERLQQLQGLTDLIGKEMHHLALELRPTTLDDLGLHTTLVNYVEAWSERSGVEVDFHSIGVDAERLPGQLETALYRIVQEGLTNVVKHAHARRISLILNRSATHVRAILEDDGCGFDAEKGMNSAARSGPIGSAGDEGAAWCWSEERSPLNPHPARARRSLSASHSRRTPGRSTMTKLRIFLADDHAVVREGLKALVNAQPDMAVVGEAADGASACEQVPQLQVDVVVLDVSMPGMSGAQAAEQLRQECPQVKVLALTVHEDKGYLRQLLEAGAAGYMLKCAAAAELIRAIRGVAEGGVYLDPSLAGKVVGGFVRKHPTNDAVEEVELSDRESAVVRLVAAGHSNKEIAGQLDISVKTVETYKARSLEKLGMHSRADLVRYALQQGWLREM